MLDVEADTVHHWTHLVVGNGKRGAVDAILECGGGDGEGMGGWIEFLQLRILVCILGNKVVLAIGINDEDLQIAWVDDERQGLLGHGIQWFEQRLGRDGETAGTLHFCYLDIGNHGRITVRGCYNQLVWSDFEQEVI